MVLFLVHAKMKLESKKIVHTLYNDLSKNNDPKFNEILEVLQKVFVRLNSLEKYKDDSPLINRLVNYLYFTAYTNKLTFSETQVELIKRLSEIGKRAGLNGIYRGNYGDISQF